MLIDTNQSNPNYDQSNNHQPNDELIKPSSSRVKLVIDWQPPMDGQPGRYILQEKDKRVFSEYMEPEKLEDTLRQLHENRDLLPQYKRVPCCTKFLCLSLRLIITILYLYINLIILQLALFNLIMLGVMLVWLRKFWGILQAVQFKFEFNYKTKAFKQFIEDQNTNVYNPLSIELVGEQEGRWIEVQLPDDIEEFNENRIDENSGEDDDGDYVEQVVQQK